MAASEAADLSHHAIVILCYRMEEEDPLPPKWENMISCHFHTILRLVGGYFVCFFFNFLAAMVLFSPHLFLYLSISGYFRPFGTLYRHGSKNCFSSRNFFPQIFFFFFFFFAFLDVL